MKKLRTNADATDNLRFRAEKLLAAKGGELKRIPLTDVLRLVQELQVHQIELDMQNQELRQAQETIDAARERYVDLYDFAPVGYFTLNHKGKIIEANLTGAGLLGLERNRLINQPFFLWVAPEFREAFRAHLQKVFETGGQQTCELKLLSHDGANLHILMESSARPDATAAQRQCHAAVSDITARKQAEKEVKLKERLLDSASDSIFLHDLKGHFLYVNEAAYRDRGYDKEELLAKDVLALLPPDYVGTRTQILQELLAQGEVTFESVNLRKDGSVMPVEIHARVLDLEDRRLILSVTRDITERKTAAEQIARLASFPQLNPNPVLEVDTAGTLTFANPAGLKVAQKLGLQDLKSLLPADLEEILRAVREAGKREFYREMEVKGAVFAEHIHFVPQFQTIRLFLVEITERRQAEVALRESEERFRSIFDLSPESILLIDPETARPVEFNDAVCRLLGYTREEFARLQISDYEVIESPEEIRTHIEKVMREGQDSFETKQRTREGDIRHLWVMVQKIALSGHPLLIYIYRDITALRQAEAEVLQGLNKLRRALHGTVAALANIVETKDPYTAGHQKRVAHLACALARELGWSEDLVEGMQVLSLLHDLGKIAVPAEILSRPGKISLAEFSIIKAHPQVGYDILKDIEFPWPVAQGVLQHHERLNGSGYPKGLSGREIIPEARILAVADVVEAMASHRPYRPALGIDRALEEITRHKGRLYDPAVVEAGVKLFSEKGFTFP